MVKKISSQKEKEIVELYKSGWGSTNIGKKLKISQTPIRRVLRENNIPVRAGKSIWQKGSPKTTTISQEKNIVQLYSSGLSKESIEDKTGIGREVITRVLRDWKVKVRSCGGVRPYDVKSDCFDDLSSEHAAYWLGFLFAELSISRSNIQISISKKDRDHLEKLRIFLGVNKSIQDFLVDKKYSVSRLYFSDRPLADKLRNVYIKPHRTYGEKIFEIIPPLTLNHFLRGWFDGDGSAFKFPQLCFVGRKPYLMKVQEIFIKNAYANPVTLKTSKGKNKNIGLLYYRGVYRCNEIANYLYRNATIWLPRKRDRILNWPPPKKVKSKRFW